MMLKRATMAITLVLSMIGTTYAQEEAPLSKISLYGGGNFLRLHADDGYDYYDDNESDTYSGVMEGAELRLVAPLGLMLDVTVENAKATRDSYSYKEQQVIAGIGYTQRLYRGGSWSVEGFYERYRVGLQSPGCDYSCNGWYTANGGGVKGGFTWPFARQWFGEVNASAAYLSFPDVDGWQGKVDGAIGFMLTEHASVSVGVASQVTGQTDRHYDNYYGYYYDQTTSIDRFDVFAKLALHF